MIKYLFAVECSSLTPRQGRLDTSILTASLEACTRQRLAVGTRNPPHIPRNGSPPTSLKAASGPFLLRSPPSLALGSGPPPHRAAPTRGIPASLAANIGV
eukprot:48169-Chlamydomonas_euryale.AAC.2